MCVAARTPRAAAATRQQTRPQVVRASCCPVARLPAVIPSCPAQLTAGTSASSLRARELACKASARSNPVFLFGFGGGQQEEYYDDEVYTVAKLQVAIFGDVKLWQERLNNLATKYDTDDEEGLFHVFQDALTLLLRNTSIIGYATSAGRVYNDLDEAEAKFNQVSLEERSRFNEETLSNYDGRRKQAAPPVRADDTSASDWLCVTLLMAVEGSIKIPKADNVYELKKAMTALGVVNSDNLVAFELLWTPQEAGESYSKDALLIDYPTMVPM